MPYNLEITSEAEDGLDRLDRPVEQRVRRKLRWLAENAALYRHEPMTGQYSGSYRIQIGVYRAVYDLDRENRRIIVLEVSHRRDAY